MTSTEFQAKKHIVAPWILEIKLTRVRTGAILIMTFNLTDNTLIFSGYKKISDNKYFFFFAN